ncbi:MAG: single-stranded DNA-binding protein, partial [Phycisphaerae bacterium]|nr:single-stranded DNA-binding protein [Phycisphaerae bacterium]
MANFNKVILIGNLTRDVEVRAIAGGQSVSKFGLAVNRKFRTKDNEEREEVTFVDCEAWGRTGEVMSQYLRKGSPVFIEGRLRLDQWEDKEGQKRSQLRVVVENFQFIGARPEGGGRRNEESSGAPARERSGSREQGSGGNEAAHTATPE